MSGEMCMRSTVDDNEQLVLYPGIRRGSDDAIFLLFR
ncbi:hypothetical protein TIFTF001_043754 [Ficus carica]|uniref:Uncharacterized protein n=1 Tax=Ficus carica TaxID=3494 RepID=A0AA87Z4K9_FICCA|nr:hypothetical protein TIFTF001_043754 [Ficus carica]